MHEEAENDDDNEEEAEEEESVCKTHCADRLLSLVVAVQLSFHITFCASPVNPGSAARISRLCDSRSSKTTARVVGDAAKERQAAKRATTSHVSKPKTKTTNPKTSAASIRPIDPHLPAFHCPTPTLQSQQQEQERLSSPLTSRNDP
eukprot:2942711-Rhodomonas_salina.3